jgi:hypothetical protein
MGRRVRRLLLTAKAPDLRDQLEAEAVSMLAVGLESARRWAPKRARVKENNDGYECG